ncbi:hypothetical protein HOK00_08575 [bacterium]|nr:hypothetical protein [bacterium]
MNINNSMNSQMQLKKMDGTGHGQGLKEVNQKLETEDREKVQESMRALSPEDRVIAREAMSKIDTSVEYEDFLKQVNDVFDLEVGLSESEDIVFSDLIN